MYTPATHPQLLHIDNSLAVVTTRQLTHGCHMATIHEYIALTGRQLTRGCHKSATHSRLPPVYSSLAVVMNRQLAMAAMNRLTPIGLSRTGIFFADARNPLVDVSGRFRTFTQIRIIGLDKFIYYGAADITSKYPSLSPYLPSDSLPFFLYGPGINFLDLDRIAHTPKAHFSLIE